MDSQDQCASIGNKWTCFTQLQVTIQVVNIMMLLRGEKYEKLVEFAKYRARNLASITTFGFLNPGTSL